MAENPEATREMNLLEQIENDPNITQASLATQLGVAVGTVNWHIKRMIAKGYVKVKRAERRKLRYIITPEGITFRARLTVDYIEQSFLLYRNIRKRVRELLVEVKHHGFDQVHIETEFNPEDPKLSSQTNDIADVCRLTCLEQGIRNQPGSICSHVVRPGGKRQLAYSSAAMNAREVYLEATQLKHVVITGGAGFIGSLLTGELLRLGMKVTVIDDLIFGGESLMGYFAHPNFHFTKANVIEPRAVRSNLRSDWEKPTALVHLAAIVGFPACQAVGRQVAWRYNVEATERVFEQAVSLGVSRLVYASSYSNYGLSPDGKPVTEASPLTPQSLYAETKIAAERFLIAQSESTCTPLIYRLATLYGISPRTRFDLIINQFVLEAYTKRELLIYQRGYSRSFVHIHDAVRGIILGLQAPDEKVRCQIYNLGSENGNYTKDQIVTMVLKRMPETVVTYKDMTFGGDMRDITVSYEKIQRELGFQTRLTPDDGIREVLHAIRTGLISDPHDQRYRNAQFIVQ